MLTIYEVILLLKNIPKEQLAGSIRRTAGYILDNSGFFRNIHYLGLQKTPYRQSKEKNPFWEAHYIFYEFHVPKQTVPEIAGNWKRDRDVIKYSIFPSNDRRPIIFKKCTFEDEMKPVPYRPEVMELVKFAKWRARNQSNKVNLHMNAHYLPFQR